MAMYENFLIADDFNSEVIESTMEDFWMQHPHDLIKDSTCFKSPDKPSCINLNNDSILTNFTKSFVKSQTLETGLSGFHKSALTVLKILWEKQKPVFF